MYSIIFYSGIRVEGFMGSLAPSGGLKVTDIAVATIEKANSLINRSAVPLEGFPRLMFLN